MTTFSMKLPETLDARLAAWASRQGVSRAAVVRKALEAFLSADDKVSPASFAEQARDLVGCVAGPADLSSNQAHLEGYGQ